MVEGILWRKRIAIGKRKKEKEKISACGGILYRFLYFLLDNCTDVQYNI
jgi:hypothetical protein